MTPPPGDATSPRRQQAAYGNGIHRWLPKRRGMAAGAVAAAALLALALLRRDAGPTWVASAVPTQADMVAGSVQSALSSSSSADDAAAAAGDAGTTVDRREALQQSASEDSTGSDSGVHPRTSAKDADGGGRSSSSSGSSHTRSSKASKAAGKAAGSASAAAAGVHSPAASAQPDQQSGDPSQAANPAADAVDGAAEDTLDSDSHGDGTGDDAASRAAGAAADADQVANQPREADGGASDGVVSDDAPQQGDSEENVQLQTNSTSAAADPSVQQGESEASGSAAASDGGQSAEIAEPAEQSASAGAQPVPAPQRARKAPRQKPKQPANRQDAAAAKAALKAGKSTGKGKGQGKRPRPAHDSFGPIQAELLAAVEAAINPDGAVMLAVTNKEGALFQLPQLLSSMRLVPQQDISRHLVVVTYSAPAQAACLRQHPRCVLDDFGTGGLGGNDGGGIDAFAAWGSRRFKGITWRKIQLVQDILLQGYAVLSVDLDIVLFKDPLDGAFNPLMNRELDAWVAVDNGKMLNCGFYFLRPTEPTDKFMKEWLGRFNQDAADDIWEQAEFNQILKGAHATMPQLKWDKLDEEWFVDLCFYLDARAVLPDQRQFGELFAATSDKLGNWDKMFGFHAACCKGGGPALPECKRSTATALMIWQIHAQPSEWP